jgi:4-amino-4-deoxy-L-arabinose transferase-like glycosyltransferase
MNAKLFIKFFLAILVAGSFLRFSKLGQIPVSLYWDETAILIDAKSIAETGMDMHGRPWYQLIYPSYGDYKLPVYIWSSGLLSQIFTPNNWTIRLTSVFAGIGTIIVGGWIARLIFKDSASTKLNNLQLSVMAVIAFSPWSIIFSRTAFEGHLAQFLLATSILLLLLAQDYLTTALKSWRAGLSFITLITASIIIGDLATYTYFSVRFVWPVVSLIFWLLYWTKYLKIKHWPKWGIAEFICTLSTPIIIFSILLVPMMKSPLYEVSNKFRLSTTSIFNGFDYPLQANILREQSGNTAVDRIFFHRHLLMIKELAKNYADHLDLNYLFLSGDQNLRHGTGQHGLFLLGSLPIFIYGIIKLWLKHKRVWATIIIWWLIALLPAAVPETTPHALRSLNALVPISITIGFGLNDLITVAKRRSYRHWWLYLVIALIGFNILNFVHFANHYFVHYPAQSAYSWQDGYQELAEIIAENKAHVTEIWVSEIDGRFYLWSLAYDQNLTSKQIQSLPKNDFQLSKIENIYFAPFDWEKLNTNHFKTLVIGETAKMEDKLLASKIKPNWIKNIKDHAGVSRFVVASFGE